MTDENGSGSATEKDLGKDDVNASEFLDLSSNASCSDDDTNEELFLETNRKEQDNDSTMSFEEIISPAVQFLTDQPKEETIDDVLRTPSNGNNNSRITFLNSNSSSMSSFHTPLGEDDGNYDFPCGKENTPFATPSEFNEKNEKRKLFRSGVLNNNNNRFIYTDETLANKTCHLYIRDSLSPQPANDKLKTILSSGEDVSSAIEGRLENSFISGTKFAIDTGADLLKNPGTLKQDDNKIFPSIFDQTLSSSSLNSEHQTETNVEVHLGEVPLLEDRTILEDSRLPFLNDDSIQEKVCTSQHGVDEKPEHSETVQMKVDIPLPVPEIPKAPTIVEFNHCGSMKDNNGFVISSENLIPSKVPEENGEKDVSSGFYSCYSTEEYSPQNKINSPASSRLIYRGIPSVSHLTKIPNPNQHQAGQSIQINQSKPKSAIQKLITPQSTQVNKRFLRASSATKSGTIAGSSSIPTPFKTTSCWESTNTLDNSTPLPRGKLPMPIKRSNSVQASKTSNSLAVVADLKMYRGNGLAANGSQGKSQSVNAPKDTTLLRGTITSNAVPLIPRTNPNKSGKVDVHVTEASKVPVHRIGLRRQSTPAKVTVQAVTTPVTCVSRNTPADGQNIFASSKTSKIPTTFRPTTATKSFKTS